MASKCSAIQFVHLEQDGIDALDCNSFEDCWVSVLILWVVTCWTFFTLVLCTTY